MAEIRRPFTEHPQSVGETYAEHLGVALGFSARLLAASLVCFVHALLPWLFTRSASRSVGRLHDRMVLNRRRHPLPEGVQGMRTEP